MVNKPNPDAIIIGDTSRNEIIITIAGSTHTQRVRGLSYDTNENWLISFWFNVGFFFFLFPTFMSFRTLWPHYL